MITQRNAINAFYLLGVLFLVSSTVFAIDFGEDVFTHKAPANPSKGILVFNEKNSKTSPFIRLEIPGISDQKRILKYSSAPSDFRLLGLSKPGQTIYVYDQFTNQLVATINAQDGNAVSFVRYFDDYPIPVRITVSVRKDLMLLKSRIFYASQKKPDEAAPAYSDNYLWSNLHKSMTVSTDAYVVTSSMEILSEDF